MSGWLDDAACRGRDVELWFPASGDVMKQAVAVAVCRACPVRCACLADALAEEEASPWGRYGVRGGLTPAQRLALAARRRVRRTAGGRSRERVDLHP